MAEIDQSLAFDLDNPSLGVPFVSNVNPSAGTGISALTPISFDVNVVQGELFRLILIVASFPGLKLQEVVYDLYSGAFGPQYQGPNNSITPFTNGYSLTILRNNGWPASPTIIPYLVDVSGNENV